MLLKLLTFKNTSVYLEGIYLFMHKAANTIYWQTIILHNIESLQMHFRQQYIDRTTCNNAVVNI